MYDRWMEMMRRYDRWMNMMNGYDRWMNMMSRSTDVIDRYDR
jgi:hypothetical protein